MVRRIAARPLAEDLGDMADPTRSYDSLDLKIAAYTERQNSLEQAFNNFTTQVTSEISKLATKLDERSRTPWATIFSAMGVLLAVMAALGGLTISPLNQAIARLEYQVNGLAAQDVTIDQFRELKSTLENQRLTRQQDVEAKFQRVENEISELARVVVTRAEVEEHWRMNDAKSTDLQRQIDEGKRDAVLAMQSRIERLEAENAQLSAARPRSP